VEDQIVIVKSFMVVKVGT